jgi:CheY-like chemotaxis protein
LVPSDKELYAGTGLGLYLVQQLVTEMQGNIKVDSDEGMGSTFTIALPLELPSLRHEPYESEVTKMSSNKFQESSNLAVIGSENLPRKKPVPQDKKLARLLLIEDNELLRIIIAKNLTLANCLVDVAANGERALELFEVGKYSLVFVDLGLPTISGYDVAVHLRKTEQGKARVPIVGITAYANEEIREACLAAGIDTVLNKPVLQEGLQNIIDHYIPIKISQ